MIGFSKPLYWIYISFCLLVFLYGLIWLYIYIYIFIYLFILSLGRVFGVQSHLKGCSFYGQQQGVRFLPLIILLRKVCPWLIGVACVVVMGNLWITFCSIVSLLMLCGVKFFWCLGSSGWCQRWLLLCFFHGGIGWGNIFQIFGIWYLLV